MSLGNQETEMANQPNQSTSGTNQDKTAQPNQSQPNQTGQQGQGNKPQDQQQQDPGNKQPGQQDQKGHPPGLTQGDNPDKQQGSSRS